MDIIGGMIMAKAKKFTYRIQYVDNTYQLVEWAKAELQSVGEAMRNEHVAVMVGEDVFRISDIRAIVFIPPVPEPTIEEKQKEADHQLSEWGFVDPDVQEWLRAAGIDINKGVNYE
jgi:hypothetical protein